MTRRIPALRCCAIVALLLGVGGAATADEEVARIDGKPITMAELEGSVAQQLEKLETQRRQLLESALQPLVDQRLLAAAAQAQGISESDLLETHVTSQLTPVSDEEIDAWYEQNKSRLRGTQEQLAPQIRDFLTRQRSQEARQSLLADLREKHEVEILLEPHRFDVDLAGATVKGPESAPITLVEFSDFQCPACRSFNPVLTQVLDEYGDQLKVAFLQFPLRSIHPQAQKAAEAALCARDQGKFWEFHDVLFDKQKELDVAQLKEHAAGLGLEASQFDECLDSDRYAEQVQADVDLAASIGATGTPTVLVNGRPAAPGKVPNFAALKALIDDELARLESR